MSDYKNTLVNIEAGDQVVITASGWGSDRQYTFATVERTTNTQIIVDGERFRRSGKLVSEDWRRLYIHAPGDQAGRKMTYADRVGHSAAANKVRDAAREFERINYSRRAEALTTTQLEQAYELMRQALAVLEATEALEALEATE